MSRKVSAPGDSPCGEPRIPAGELWILADEPWILAGELWILADEPRIPAGEPQAFGKRAARECSGVFN